LASNLRFRIFSWSDILKKSSLIKDEVIAGSKTPFYDIGGYDIKRLNAEIPLFFSF
jgi:hypothetical protein